jgi:proteasome activator subunit 4
MATDLLENILAATGIDLKDLISNTEDSEIDMDEDDMSDVDATGAGEDGILQEQSALEKQQASLQTYLNSVPYECESVEEMQASLEEIVGKIMICAHAKNWLLLTTWDANLQWCVLNLLVLQAQPQQIKRLLLFSAGCLCVIPCPK